MAHLQEKIHFMGLVRRFLCDLGNRNAHCFKEMACLIPVFGKRLCVLCFLIYISVESLDLVTMHWHEMLSNSVDLS